MRRPVKLKLKYFLKKMTLCDVWKLFSYVKHMSWFNNSLKQTIWKPYLFFKNIQSCFWPGRTTQNHLKIPAYMFLGIPIAMVVVRSCLTKSSWDKICILLNNGNFAKNNPHLGILPIPPLTPLFCPPQINLMLI